MKKFSVRPARRVMVFGTFDGLHLGHLHFLRQAKKHGEYLIAVVARDRVVLQFKMKLPRYSAKERMKMLKESGVLDRVTLGDGKPGSWDIIRKEKPDSIALGYDQQEIAKELRAKRSSFSHPFRITVAKAHRPRTFHSRLIKNRD